MPQIPSIQFWRGSGGATSERGFQSNTPQMHAIFGSERGRRHQAAWEDNLDGLEASPGLITSREVLRKAVRGTIGFDGRLNLEMLVNTNQIIPQTGQALVIR